MSKTKHDLVAGALRKAGLASSTTLTGPEPESIADGVNDLESLMAMWDAQGIRISYDLADPSTPIDPSAESGIPDWAVIGVVCSLAEMMLIDNERPAKPSLSMLKAQGMDTIRANTYSVPELVRRNDMPRGAGHKAETYGRFYVEPDPLKTDDGDIILE